MTIKGLASAAFAALLALSCPSAAQDALDAKVLEYGELDGWEEDNLQAALTVFRDTCGLIRGREWASLCGLSKTQTNAKTFFELFFRPVLVKDGQSPLFTGYFEPEISGSRYRTDTYRYPVYRRPRDLATTTPYFTRQDISNGALAGRGLEIAWVEDPVDLYFLQVQGSGRIRLSDGDVIRVGYAAHNGHDRMSLGQALVRKGVYNVHQVSAPVIKNWVRRNPIDGLALLNQSPSYVFFREIKSLSPSKGPVGAMNRSISPLRTIAVDPAYVTLGAPVWLEKEGAAPLRRLMVAQDVGSAIKGPQRADIFLGTGDAAGEVAGRIRDTGRMIVLMPIQLAYGLEEQLSQ